MYMRNKTRNSKNAWIYKSPNQTQTQVTQYMLILQGLAKLHVGLKENSRQDKGPKFNELKRKHFYLDIYTL